MSLRRAHRREFSEFRKMQQVRNFINQNPLLFVSGMEFEVPRILHEFRVYAPNYTGLSPEDVINAHTSHTNKRSQWQNRFNRVLAQRGMYMSKKYKHNLWEIRTDDRVQAKIQALTTDARRNRARSNELRNGFTSFHNTWRDVSDRTLRRIVESGNPADWASTDYVDPDIT